VTRVNEAKPTNPSSRVSTNLFGLDPYSRLAAWDFSVTDRESEVGVRRKLLVTGLFVFAALSHASDVIRVLKNHNCLRVVRF
jgi:hypothetical protein